MTLSSEKLVSSAVSVLWPIAPKTSGTVAPPSSQHRTTARLPAVSSRALSRAVLPHTALHGTVMDEASPSPVPLSLVVASEASETDRLHEHEGTSMGRRSSPVMVSAV